MTTCEHRNALVAVLVTLSVVALTYAGVCYVIAGGNATGVEKAKGAAKSAVIGLRASTVRASLGSKA